MSEIDIPNKEAPHVSHGESDIRDLPKAYTEVKYYEGGLIILGWAIDFLKKAENKGLRLEEVEEVFRNKHGMLANLYMKAWRDYRELKEVIE